MEVGLITTAIDGGIDDLVMYPWESTTDHVSHVIVLLDWLCAK